MITCENLTAVLPEVFGNKYHLRAALANFYKGCLTAVNFLQFTE